MRPGDEAEFVRAEDAGEPHEIADGDLVDALGAFGEVFEPLDLGRKFREALKFGGSEPPVGAVTGVGNWVSVLSGSGSSGMSFFLRQSRRSKNLSTSKAGSPSISMRGSVAASSNKIGGGMLAPDGDQSLNCGRWGSRESAMQRQSIAATRG